MITKKYICDICGSTEEKQEYEKTSYRVIQIGISKPGETFPLFESDYFNDNRIPYRKLICKECSRDLGVDAYELEKNRSPINKESDKLNFEVLLKNFIDLVKGEVNNESV